MEFKATIDAGQLLVAGAISVIGYFVKKELSTINNRLNGHDSKIFDLMKQVSTLIGAFNARYGPADRRADSIT